MNNKKANSSWDFGNKILYEMCRNHPRHTDESEIAGKIWLIGRAYSATIERQAGRHMSEGQDFYLTRVAPMIKEARVDDWLEPLKGLKRIYSGNFEMVLCVHKQFMDLLAEISGVQKRSLASKYLHFHLPQLFFIFDSRAKKKISSIMPNARYPRTANSDHEYNRFVQMCMQYRNENLEKSLGRKVSPRELDAHLLDY